jgi:hypothetical protein
MVKIQIKSIFGDVIFEYEKENNTIKDTLEKAIISGANLSWVNLSGANISGVNLSNSNLYRANLYGVNLSNSNLYKANLSSANLSNANISWAELNDKKIISISRIGSRNGMTVYDFDNDIIWCGCFKGSLDDFENRVNETHKNNTQYLKEYLGFINYLKSLK